MLSPLWGKLEPNQMKRKTVIRNSLERPRRHEHMGECPSYGRLGSTHEMCIVNRRMEFRTQQRKAMRRQTNVPQERFSRKKEIR
mmetsp:Transcript_64678/g.116392  ORF Transcript_64678/g.116392 Transcript_64678/m.116392 type:complete len:84 (+) Transcript_64678:172-423(+)